MPALVMSLLAGTIFGAGLAVSQMINPAKVIGFLDLAGDWDPTLAFVMAGALAVATPGFALVRRRARPLFAETFQVPTRTAIEPRLLAGAALFGLGWGLAGFCPGPALAALASGLAPVWLFVGAMIAGMAAGRVLVRE